MKLFTQREKTEGVKGFYFANTRKQFMGVYRDENLELSLVSAGWPEINNDECVGKQTVKLSLCKPRETPWAETNNSGVDVPIT